MINTFINESIVKRAQESKKVTINIVNLREFGEGTYNQVDDRPYGGGAGMVLMVEPLVQAIKKNTRYTLHATKNNNPKPEAPNPKQRIILTSAKGKSYTQKKAQELSNQKELIIICGHYEGIDERVMDYVDEEISLGDFVLTGGEIAACAIVDSIVRLVPGVLKKEEATEEESFFEVSVQQLLKLFPDDKSLQTLQEKKIQSITLLEYPHYTRPDTFEKVSVPKVLLSGNHKDIKEWRLTQAYLQTKQKRPDLLR